MIGIVLGLGFQWWPELTEPWQYLAFLFVYIDIIDYWIDYAPSLKKYAPKREVDIILDVAITFNLFLYIFSTQREIILFFLISFGLMRILDILWIRRATAEYPHDHRELNKWVVINLVEAVWAVLLIASSQFYNFSAIPILISVVIFWIATRIFTLAKFKQLHIS